MRAIMPAALAAAIVAAGSSAAFAQRVGVEIDTGEPYYYRYEQPAPGAYRYYRSFDERPTVVVPLRPANCGQYRYWNGQRCVDARVVPPDLR